VIPDAAASAQSRCPRCGAAFHCGATDPVPCACTQVELSDVTLAQLRADYVGCLCLACLRALADAERAHAAAVRPG
jgi:hypothetical protein